jgi:hypothetical protein
MPGFNIKDTNSLKLESGAGTFSANTDVTLTNTSVPSGTAFRYVSLFIHLEDGGMPSKPLKCKVWVENSSGTIKGAIFACRLTEAETLEAITKTRPLMMTETGDVLKVRFDEASGSSSAGTFTYYYGRERLEYV